MAKLSLRLATDVRTTKEALPLMGEVDTCTFAGTDGSAEEGRWLSPLCFPLAGVRRHSRKEGDKSKCCADVQDCSTASEDGAQTNECIVVSEKLGAIAIRHKAQTLVIDFF